MTLAKHSWAYHLKRRAKDLLFDRSFCAVYDRYSRAPVEEKILFVEYRAAQPSENFRLLMKRLRQEHPEMQLHFHSLNRQGADHNLDFIRRSRKLLRDMATAKYVFLCDANEIVSCVKKRPETKVIQLWHACGAFKKFGLSTIGNRFGPDGEGMLAHPYYGNVDLVTVSSPEIIPHYAQAMGVPEQIVIPLGISRTDVFFDPDFLQRSRDRLQRAVPQAADKKVILYAPTFRGKPSAATAPELPDLEGLRSALGENFVLLIKQHPFVKDRPRIPAGAEAFAVDVTEQLEIGELLAVSDVCITDYSSLVFEYSLFGRPMVFYAYDLDNYNDWRGFYYPYEEMTPGPVVRSSEELIRALEEFAGGDTRWIQETEIFRQRFMSACDGHATERILEEVFAL